jgi:hypothetical protein
VHAMIVEGAARGIWAFADKSYQARAIVANDREQELLARVSKKAGEADHQKAEVAARNASALVEAGKPSAPQPQQTASCQAGPQPTAASVMAPSKCISGPRAQPGLVAARQGTGADVHARAEPGGWSVVVGRSPNTPDAAPQATRSSATSSRTESPRPFYEKSAMREAD